MAREPGRKFKTETLEIDGVQVDLPVRVDEKGKFHARIGGGWLEAATLKELKDLARPLLAEDHRLQFDPFIEIDVLKPEDASQYSNKRDGDTEEVRLEFRALWVSRSRPVAKRWDRDKMYHVTFPARVDDAGALVPMTQDDRAQDWKRETSDGQNLIPFTPERWARLLALHGAIRQVRASIHRVLSDATGATLDALDGVSVQKLIPALPEGAPAKGKKRGSP